MPARQPPPPPEGGGNLLTRKMGPLPGWGWLVVAFVGFYLYKRFSSSSSGASTTASTGAQPVTASVTLPGGYSYSGPASGAAAFQQTAMGSGAAPSPGNPGAGAVSPGNTGNAAFNTGYGVTNVAGVGPAIVLGPAGGQVYQVGGGEPVYFGNTENAAEGPAAMAAAGQGAGYAYTPLASAPFVASAPVQVGPGQF